MDEVYALSVWAENRFRSVLSLGDIPDPSKTHFVRSFSKVSWCNSEYNAVLEIVVYTEVC